MLEDKSFRGMVYALRSSARVPQKKDCITTMRGVKKHMMSKVAHLLKGEHVCITSDGWTSCANDTYMSLTVSLIPRSWKLITLSVDCSKSAGTTTGDALAAGIVAAVAKHEIKGKVTAITTDCEPSMVKMGRILEDNGVCTHVGCCNHRLESTTSLVFNGPGVKKAMTLARGLVTRYTTSSQMADRLAQFVKIYLNSDGKKPIQDVVTRWWSTCQMVLRLLELREAIEKHEEADKLEPMLMAADWAVLEMILPVLEPFMDTQLQLEGRKYVTGSLVVPYIHQLRNNLEGVMLDLETEPASDDAVVNNARAAVEPCVKALHKDFINRWGDGSEILTYKEGTRRQPRGFKSVQVLATALDPRTKHLYGISADQHADVWKLVQTEAVKIALQNRQAPTSEVGVEAFQAALSLQMYEEKTPEGGDDEGEDDTEEGEDDSEKEDDTEEEQMEGERSRVYLDPLEWWRVKSADFPHLAVLARRVLAIPATQAESERLFSCAGNIVTKTRNRLAPSTVELLVLL
ncbi:unnamed protein product, partial [Scytosiphon promiscuus]